VDTHISGMQEVTKERKEQFKRFDKNLEWFQSNYEELKKQYNNEYVAIDNQRLLDHNPDLERLIERIRREYGDLGAFVIEYLTDKKLQLLL
jgi:thymidylate kinase